MISILLTFHSRLSRTVISFERFTPVDKPYSQTLAAVPHGLLFLNASMANQESNTVCHII
jgi:hypothetical protein